MVSVSLGLLNVIVNSPSVPGSDAAAIVADISMVSTSLSSIVPVAVSVSVTLGLSAFKDTVKVSSASVTLSSV